MLWDLRSLNSIDTLLGYVCMNKEIYSSTSTSATFLALPINFLVKGFIAGGGFWLNEIGFGDVFLAYTVKYYNLG